jgi:hypothetical protein
VKKFGPILLMLLAIAAPSFAVDVTAPSVNVNVAATSTTVSTRDTRRILILQNYSDATIYCKSGGATAVVGEGLVLNPSGTVGQAGGAFFFDVVVPTGTINCINGGSGNKVLVVTEG